MKPTPGFRMDGETFRLSRRYQRHRMTDSVVVVCLLCTADSEKRGAPQRAVTPTRDLVLRCRREVHAEYYAQFPTEAGR